MSKGRLYLLFALLLFVLGCVGCVYFLVNAQNDSYIDTRIIELNNKITEKEKKLIQLNEKMLTEKTLYESALDAYNATSGLRLKANEELQKLYNEKKELMSGAFMNRLQ